MNEACKKHADAPTVGRWECGSCALEKVRSEKYELAIENKKLRAELAALKAGQGEAVELSVWCGSMPESNGKSNYTAILHRKGECISEGITLDRSEYPDRVRYEADRMRFLIGELTDEPDILAYDADAHSGYTAPPATGVIDPGWRCFQCGEHFTDEESAGLHFGTHQHQSPACLIDIAEYRAMEARMHSYNEGDAEIHRAMARMHGQHRTALQREEEKGYARALKDTGYDATGVNVPRELLERAMWPKDGSELIKANRELRALLVQSQEVKS